MGSAFANHGHDRKGSGLLSAVRQVNASQIDTPRLEATITVRRSVERVSLGRHLLPRSQRWGGALFGGQSKAGSP
jgi:hypothetical protein